MHCEYFDTTRNSNHSSFPTPTLVVPFRVKYSTKVTHPFEKRHLLFAAVASLKFLATENMSRQLRKLIVDRAGGS